MKADWTHMRNTMQNIVLSADAYRDFLEELAKPPKPNSVLQKAADDYRREIEEGLIVSEEEDEGEQA